jgi:23S rRNA A2030 N6-methylase RlmJ
LSMNNKAGNIGDIPKHFLLLELTDMILTTNPNATFCFYDAFGGNVVTDNCHEDAIIFYNFVSKVTKNGSNEPFRIKLRKSEYYQIMNQQMWYPSQKNLYYGSTKWVLELIKKKGTPNYKLFWNSYEYSDVEKALLCINRKENLADREKIGIQYGDAYQLLKDYEACMRAYTQGILFFDPYWNPKRFDESHILGLLPHLSKSIKQNPFWSLVIWIPYYNWDYVKTSKSIYQAAKRNFSPIPVECYSIMSNSITSNQTMQGVGLIVINPPQKSDTLHPLSFSERLKCTGFEHIQKAYKGRRNYKVYCPH